jgi:hypothetical protein
MNYVKDGWQQESLPCRLVKVFPNVFPSSKFNLILVLSQQSKSSQAAGEEESDSDSEINTPTLKRQISSSSNRSEKSNKRKETGTDRLANAAMELKDTIKEHQLFRAQKRDFVMETLDKLNSFEISKELSQEDCALGMVVFHDEMKAKIFSLTSSTERQLLFLKREIALINKTS